MNNIIKNCEFCGKEIIAKFDSRRGYQKFCSKECSNKGKPFKTISQSDYDKIKILVSLEEFNKLRTMQVVEIKCNICNKIYKTNKVVIIRTLTNGGIPGYCSATCFARNKTIKANLNKVTVNCDECGKLITTTLKQTQKYNNTFCSYSCNAKYRNKNKKLGQIRSKMEIFIEQKIREKYPHLTLICNERDLLGGNELDFYFPNFKLAIELNGITHYEPIYGADRLTRSQQSDKNKMLKCHDLGIELAVIDISNIKYFKEDKGLIILSEIEKIIIPFLQ